MLGLSSIPSVTKYESPPPAIDSVALTTAMGSIGNNFNAIQTETVRVDMVLKGLQEQIDELRTSVKLLGLIEKTYPEVIAAIKAGEAVAEKLTT